MRHWTTKYQMRFFIAVLQLSIILCYDTLKILKSGLDRGPIIDCIDIIWNDTPWDEKRYASGFVCRTMKEALDVAEKMLAVAKYRVKKE